MSNCHDIEIEGLVFGGLTPEVASRVRAHLASCQRCSDEHAALTRERGLFADRRRTWAREGEGRDQLPDFEVVLARAESVSPGLLRRALSVLVGSSEAGGTRMGQVVIAAAAGLCLFGVARHHGAPLEASGASSVGKHASAHEATISHGVVQSNSPDDVGDPCSEEESVCREHGFALRMDRAMSAVVPSQPSGVKCNTEQLKTTVPSPFDQTRADSEAMCVADEI